MNGPLAILGGGQLAQMMARAAIDLGLRARVLDPDPGCPAAANAEVVVGAYDDSAAIDRLIDGAGALTYEFENVPAQSLAHAAARGLHADPSALALSTAQDRIPEKQCFRAQGLDTAPFAAVDSLIDLRAAVAAIGLPGVLKTRRLGYDGKGQVVIRDAHAVDAAWNRLGTQPLIYEGFVAFDEECSLLSVRGRDGEVRCWPLVVNRHEGGILRLSLSPAAGVAHLQAQAEAHARRILGSLGYVGVLAIEFFRCGDRLIGNEMAPRVHNSGHGTIEGSVCSQFENHVRAVCGLPLGSTAARGAHAMLNLIGSMPPRGELLSVEGLHLHDYGKPPRPGRKLGHVTLVDADAQRLHARVADLRTRFGLG